MSTLEGLRYDVAQQLHAGFCYVQVTGYPIHAGGIAHQKLSGRLACHPRVLNAFVFESSVGVIAFPPEGYAVSEIQFFSEPELTQVRHVWSLIPASQHMFAQRDGVSLAVELQDVRDELETLKTAASQQQTVLNQLATGVNEILKTMQGFHGRVEQLVSRPSAEQALVDAARKQSELIQVCQTLADKSQERHQEVGHTLCAMVETLKTKVEETGARTIQEVRTGNEVIEQKSRAQISLIEKVQTQSAQQSTAIKSVESAVKSAQSATVAELERVAAFNKAALESDTPNTDNNSNFEELEERLISRLEEHQAALDRRIRTASAETSADIARLSKSFSVSRPRMEERSQRITIKRESESDDEKKSETSEHSTVVGSMSVASAGRMGFDTSTRDSARHLASATQWMKLLDQDYAPALFVPFPHLPQDFKDYGFPFVEKGGVDDLSHFNMGYLRADLLAVVGWMKFSREEVLKKIIKRMKSINTKYTVDTMVVSFLERATTQELAEYLVAISISSSRLYPEVDGEAAKHETGNARNRRMMAYCYMVRARQSPSEAVDAHTFVRQALGKAELPGEFFELKIKIAPIEAFQHVPKARAAPEAAKAETTQHGPRGPRTTSAEAFQRVSKKQ